MTLSNSQKTYLQFMLSVGVMDTAETKAQFKRCRERYEEDPNIEGLRDFIKGINAELKPLHMEIRKGADEDTSAPCYVLVNLVESSGLLNTGKYNQKQTEYFKILMREIVTSSDGYITTIDAMNLVDGLVHKLTKREASEVIRDWTTNRWLKFDPEKEAISLSQRSIVELDPYLREVYADTLGACEICHRLAIKGVVCPHCECKIHPGCLRSWLRKNVKNGSVKCPKSACSKARTDLDEYMPT